MQCELITLDCEVSIGVSSGKHCCELIEICVQSGLHLLTDE